MRTVEATLLGLLLVPLPGCWGGGDEIGKLDAVWGRRGVSDGRFQKPRAMAVDADDRIYVVDMSARIQVFDTEGNFLRGWRTPECVNGKPTGLSIGIDGQLLVADTHYYRVLIYSPQGEQIGLIGGLRGEGPGEFGLVTDAVQDSRGNLYVAEMGEFDRIQKFSPDGRFLKQWGGHGSEPGQFLRPQNMAVDQHDQIWVADACNHRIQEFDTDGKLLRCWGAQGGAPGELYYPYDLLVTPDEQVYVCEFGNHRVQKFTVDGEPLGCWGSEGRQEGQLFNPWALGRDSDGRVYVLDTNNHRVQRVKM
jgi:DNA-binding beta-propeller fold protein YncE